MIYNVPQKYCKNLLIVILSNFCKLYQNIFEFNHLGHILTYFQVSQIWRVLVLIKLSVLFSLSLKSQCKSYFSHEKSQSYTGQTKNPLWKNVLSMLYFGVKIITPPRSLAPGPYLGILKILHMCVILFSKVIWLWNLYVHILPLQLNGESSFFIKCQMLLEHCRIGALYPLGMSFG